VFQVGDQVRVRVLKFDAETERVSLGLKQTQPDPWISIGDRYPIGLRLHGKVVSLADYGAFVELEPGIEGLIHISEMSWTKRVKHPSKVVAIGDEVDVLVLEVDPQNRKISLGMKQTEQDPWSLLEERYPPGTKVHGVVRNVTNFGVFVGIEEGIDGLVHVSDISWTQKIRDPKELFKKGDELEAVVLKVDTEAEVLPAWKRPANPGTRCRASSRWERASRARSRASPTSACSWRSRKASRGWSTPPKSDATSRT
jgi:small subunit ribosomal protein S1